MSIYTVIYHHDIPGDLTRIPENIRRTIQRAIEQRLLIDPISYGLPLRKNFHGHRKLRVGDYRIIYRVEGKTIIVVHHDLTTVKKYFDWSDTDISLSNLPV